MILHTPQETGDFKRKLYSISSSTAEQNTFDLLAKILPQGIGSDYLKKIKIGDEVIFDGPAGVFSLKENEREKILIATGTGIAPVRSILLTHLKKYTDVNFSLFWGLKSMRDVYYFDDFMQLSRDHPHFTFTICLSREESLDALEEEQKPYFALGHADKVIEEKFTLHALLYTLYDYYLCGDANIVESLRQFLLNKEVSPEQLTFEKFV